MTFHSKAYKEAFDRHIAALRHLSLARRQIRSTTRFVDHMRTTSPVDVRGMTVGEQQKSPEP